MIDLSACIPMDRRQALAQHQPLPDRQHSAALFADICGFTTPTDAQAAESGPKQGAEELTVQLNHVDTELIAEVHRFGGSVIVFSGAAITGWFNQGDPGRLATACALAMPQMKAGPCAWRAKRAPD